MVINKFSGEYRFLSNFFPCELEIDGVCWPSVEHYYVAMKTDNPEIQEEIRNNPSPGKVKRIGRSLVLISNWDEIKLDVMNKAVRAKFNQNPDLAALLIATENSMLVEGNTWGDVFWGVCNGKGENWLGKILMQTRSEIF